MKPSESLAKHRDEVLEIIAKYPVSNPRVFGSVARGEDVEGSDIDIMVDHGGDLSLMHLARMEIELAAKLSVPVGVHTPAEFGPKATARLTPDLRSL